MLRLVFTFLLTALTCFGASNATLNQLAKAQYETSLAAYNKAVIQYEKDLSNWALKVEILKFYTSSPTLQAPSKPVPPKPYVLLPEGLAMVLPGTPKSEVLRELGQPSVAQRTNRLESLQYEKHTVFLVNNIVVSVK